MDKMIKRELKENSRELVDLVKKQPKKYAKGIKRNYNYGKQGAVYAAKKIAGLETDKAIKNRLNKAFKKWKSNRK